MSFSYLAWTGVPTRLSAAARKKQAKSNAKPKSAAKAKKSTKKSTKKKGTLPAAAKKKGTKKKKATPAKPAKKGTKRRGTGGTGWPPKRNRTRGATQPGPRETPGGGTLGTPEVATRGIGGTGWPRVAVPTGDTNSGGTIPTGWPRLSPAVESVSAEQVTPGGGTRGVASEPAGAAVPTTDTNGGGTIPTGWPPELGVAADQFLARAGGYEGAHARLHQLEAFRAGRNS
jgi:hypothetical protein